jgi:hypothetical protein
LLARHAFASRLPYRPAVLLHMGILLPLEWGFALVLEHPRDSWTA